jgi:hypothetical protein
MALHDGHDFAQISVYGHSKEDKKDDKKPATDSKKADAKPPATTQEKSAKNEEKVAGAAATKAVKAVLAGGAEGTAIK